MILDYNSKCDNQHCPNPIRIKRYLEDNNLTKEETKMIHFFLDECDQCRTGFERMLREIKLSLKLATIAKTSKT